jgi:HSP20 family protein
MPVKVLVVKLRWPPVPDVRSSTGDIEMAEPASKLPTKSAERDIQPSGGWSPLASLRSEIDHLFEDFPFDPWRSSVGRNVFDVEPSWRGELTFGNTPAVDIAEGDKEYEITAELPGMEERDIDVKYADGVLTIKGEKKEETEEKRKDYYISERRFGSFQRSFQVPAGIEADKIDASFKNGVLTVTLPKSVEAQKREKKIEIKKG